MFAPQGPEPIVAIKAGKCKVEPHRDEAKRAAGKLWITPQKDRGEVIVVKKDDVNHFQWRSREMPCAVDPNIDTMVFPRGRRVPKDLDWQGRGSSVYPPVQGARRPALLLLDAGRGRFE